MTRIPRKRWPILTAVSGLMLFNAILWALLILIVVKHL
jgi:hypothetical protein